MKKYLCENKNAELMDERVITSSSNLMDVIESSRYKVINDVRLYVYYFNVIPSYQSERKINCVKANNWLKKEFGEKLNEIFFTKTHHKNDDKPIIDDVFYLFEDDLMIIFDTSNSIVRFFFKNTPKEKIEYISKQIRKFKYRKSSSKPEISLILNACDGIETKSMSINKQKNNLEQNYNDDFLPIHTTILHRLNKKNDKGIVLLHGKPGTGKTSYIRYLVTQLKKNILFIPPKMAPSITDPNLISILINNPNSILVIEDAENIVIDRERDEDSPVSTLLNLADGLLSDCLNIQLICSFNTDITKIDKALMRKGRLIAKYEFNELTQEKSQKLSDKLGFNRTIQRPMILTDIYNQNEAEFSNRTERTPIGFRMHNIA